MSLNKEQVACLDEMSDTAFIAWIWLNYGTREPIWKRITKGEYEKYCGKADDFFTFDKLEKIHKNLFEGIEFRMVPYYKNGGGILAQISDKEPDGYYYEKCTEYRNVLMLQGDLFEYCQTRECMKPYYNKEVI